MLRIFFAIAISIALVLSLTACIDDDTRAYASSALSSVNAEEKASNSSSSDGQRKWGSGKYGGGIDWGEDGPPVIEGGGDDNKQVKGQVSSIEEYASSDGQRKWGSGKYGGGIDWGEDGPPVIEGGGDYDVPNFESRSDLEYSESDEWREYAESRRDATAGWQNDENIP